MNDALNKYLPGCHNVPSFGGSSYWINAPRIVDAAKIKQIAMQNSILIEPGKIHFMDQEDSTHGSNYFRLGFSSISSDRIEAGIKKLAEIIRQTYPDL